MEGTPLRTPDLDELRTFCAAADLGGIGRAAQRLHVTQPAVSRRLQGLEDLVGARLLERSPRGVTLTPAGERLYAHARPILAELDALAETIAGLRGTAATVRLVLSHTAAEHLLAGALARMQQESQAPVEVVVANSRTVKRMVAAGEVDVGVAACDVDEQPPGVVTHPLIDDEIVIVVPLNHPWARMRSISPQELLATAVVRRDPGAHTRQVVDGALREHGVLAAACEVGSTAAAKEEARGRCLPAVMSRMAVAPADGLEIVEVRGVAFRRRFCVLQPPGSGSAAATQLLQAFRDSAAADGR